MLYLVYVIVIMWNQTPYYLFKENDTTSAVLSTRREEPTKRRM